MRLLKAKLVSKVDDVIVERDLSDGAAGAIMGLSRQKVSELRNGRTDDYSVERLYEFLNSLGVNRPLRSFRSAELRSHPRPRCPREPQAPWPTAQIQTSLPPSPVAPARAWFVLCKQLLGALPMLLVTFDNQMLAAGGARSMGGTWCHAPVLHTGSDVGQSTGNPFAFIVRTCRSPSGIRMTSVDNGFR